jgi:hypothetical protein
MKHRSIYTFEVLDRIIGGDDVYVVDKKYKVLAKVSDLKIEEFAEIQKQHKEESTRFEFWVDEDETEEEENA